MATLSIAAVTLAACLLTFEANPKLAVDNDVHDWWTHTAQWAAVAGVTVPDSKAYEHDQPIVLPPQLSTDSEARLTGSIDADVAALSQYRELKASISTRLRGSQWRGIAGWFTGQQAAGTRDTVARALGVHPLPLPPNYRKPFWREVLKKLGADPGEQGRFFAWMYRYRSKETPLVLKSIMYDFEPWWLYCIVWPTALLIACGYARAFLALRRRGLDIASVFKRDPLNLPAMGWLIMGAVMALGGIAFGAGSFLGFYLPWPQRVLVLLIVVTAYVPGAVMFGIVAASLASHPQTERWTHRAGRRVSPRWLDIQKWKLDYFNLCSIWLGILVVRQRADVLEHNWTQLVVDWILLAIMPIACARAVWGVLRLLLGEGPKGLWQRMVGLRSQDGFIATALLIASVPVLVRLDFLKDLWHVLGLSP